MADRLASACVGAVFGAAVGLAVAWFLGVYSNTLGPGEIVLSFSRAAITGAGIFGTIGAVFGSSVGTLLGNVISGLFAFERGDDRSLPFWPTLFTLIALAAAVVWFARSSA